MITLHHCHEARSMRTLWLLYEMELDFELKVYPFGKELRTPEYLAVHPLGRVPCLQDEDLILFETGAITEYLVEKYPEKDLGRLPGNAERPHWLQWLHYAETVAVHGATLTQQHIVIYEDADRSPLLMKLERRRLEKTLEVLDNQLSDGREYLLESGFSAIDTNMGYSVHISRYFTPLAALPHLSAYYERLSARPAFQKSLPEKPAIYNKPFYDLPQENNR
ncbi:MAG: glutathione S-transferase family protein [Nitratireductor sp.]|nr:glutathione S-transferase family protein [Nitratireductor sp.]